MKTFTLTIILFLFLQIFSFAQTGTLPGKEVFKNDDVVFHQVDEHTWIGTGHMMYNESMYLLEGYYKALLIDAGTNIRDLDKIVATLTKKPVMLVATHVHPDHTGSIRPFPEIYINAADTILMSQFMAGYTGQVKFLADGQVIDLGGRKIEVVFTPAHTPGSTTFMDAKSGYGFSGDSFGSGNLLLSMDFSTLISTCQKAGAFMDKNGIKFLYPGHYFGNNPEMRQRLDDMITLSRDVLSGRVKGESNPNGMMGLNLVASDYGVRINYNEKAVK